MAGKFAAARIGVLAVALGVVLTGCTGPIQPDGGASSATAIWPTHESSSATPSASPSLTDDQLYQLAVEQYQGLFTITTDLEQVGGAPRLPDLFAGYLVDPAWSSINEFYSIMYERGDRYTGRLDSKIIATAKWLSDKTPNASVTAIQTCELSQGAELVDADGEVIYDGSPVIMHRWAYFKFDPVDNKLKVFILNGEAVDTCPIG